MRKTLAVLSLTLSLVVSGNAKADIIQKRVIPSVSSDIHNVEVLTLTIWGEAKRTSVKDMYNVGSVIVNRFHHPTYRSANHNNYTSIYDVVSEPGQFQVWRNHGKKLKQVKKLDHKSKDFVAYQTAKVVAADLLTNGSKSSNFYFNSKHGVNFFHRNAP